MTKLISGYAPRYELALAISCSRDSYDLWKLSAHHRNGASALVPGGSAEVSKNAKPLASAHALASSTLTSF